jgi:hypothetical protein
VPRYTCIDQIKASVRFFIFYYRITVKDLLKVKEVKILAVTQRHLGICYNLELSAKRTSIAGILHDDVIVPRQWYTAALADF